MEESNSKRLACYAALKAGLSGNSYMEAFDRLLLALISKNRYKTIENKVLSEDFTKEYGFEMSYFPMAEIVGHLKKDKFIIKDNQNFIPNLPKIEALNIELELKEKIYQFDELIDDFKQYCLTKFDKSFNDEKLLEYIDSFLENQSKYFITKSKAMKHCEPNDPDFFFYSYIKHIKETNTIYFEYFQSIVIGNLLANYITYDEVTKNEANFKQMRIFIDTGFAFRLLGVDELGREDVYKTIINELRKLGVKVFMFNHSYLEMVNIIRSSTTWVGNSQYSFDKGSQTTFYFLSNNYSKEDINEFADTCKIKLQHLGVQISNYEYPEPNLIIEPHEQNILDEIINEYKRRDRDFTVRKETLEKDARSLFYLFQQRRNELTTCFADTKYIFVTTNHTLARLSKKIANDYCCSKNIEAFPPCITDVLLGTIIWIRSPMKLIEYNSRLLIPQAYYAFQPSELLIKKMDKVLNELTDLHEIDPRLCYEMKTNSLIMDKIVEITQNDPDLFNEETPRQAIESMKIEIAEKTRNDVTMELESQISTIKNEHESEMIKEVNSHIIFIKKHLEEINDSIDRDNIELNEKTLLLEKKRKKVSWIINLSAIFSCLIFVNIMYIIWDASQTQNNYFEFATYCIPIILWLINYIFKKLKNISIEKIIHNLFENSLNKEIKLVKDVLTRAEAERIKFLEDLEKAETKMKSYVVM